MSRPDSRPRCPHCHRALRTCICSLAQAVAHQAEVLILMHPMEVHEAKGTGHLLHLCLPHSRVMVGEEFDAAELEAALHGSWTSWADTDGAPRHSLLLYPDTAEQDAALGLAAASPLPLPWPQPPERLRLVVIDGTWRKSRKMLYLNPASFEAAAQALAQLHNWTADGSANATLHEVFKQFVTQQLQLRQRNQAPQRSA